MKSLGDQFADIINGKTPTVFETVALYAADEIAERMKDNSATGRGFGDDEYDPVYSEKYAEWREDQGLQASVVELRAHEQRIERTRIEYTAGSGAQISFQEGGNIFRFHHEGVQYKSGTKTRSVFPKAIGSVPPDLRAEIDQRVRVGLSGS